MEIASGQDVVRVGAEVVPRCYVGAEGAARLGVLHYLVGPRFLGRPGHGGARLAQTVEVCTSQPQQTCFAPVRARDERETTSEASHRICRDQLAADVDPIGRGDIRDQPTVAGPARPPPNSGPSMSCSLTSRPATLMVSRSEIATTEAGTYEGRRPRPVARLKVGNIIAAAEPRSAQIASVSPAAVRISVEFAEFGVSP
jgi:hypothetical protein